MALFEAVTERLGGRRRRELADRALALGADPHSSPALLVRARELEREDTRRGLAACIVNLIEAAEEPRATWIAHGIEPPLRCDAVLGARESLVALAEALRSSDRASVRGAALASCLVSDRLSPVYKRATPTDLSSWAGAARDQLLQHT